MSYSDRQLAQILSRLRELEQEVTELRLRDAEPSSWITSPMGEGRLFKTPVGGIAARSGTTVSSATCTEYKLVSGTLTTNTETETVYNPWPVAIPAGYYIVAQQEQISSEWIALFPGIVDVRYVHDTALEQSLDKVNYTNIETPQVC